MAREAEAPIERVMRSPVVTVTPQDTLERAAELMLEREISGLPVLDKGRLVGVITESDVLRAFTRLLGPRESGARVVLSVAEGADLVEEIRRRTAFAKLPGTYANMFAYVPGSFALRNRSGRGRPGR